jgi:hypothetical protein
MLFTGCGHADYLRHQSVRDAETEWAVTAHPVDEHDPDDPVEILGMLPRGYHAQFLAEYTTAVEGALRPEQFRELQELLRTWRPRAVAYSGAGYEERLAAVSHGGAAAVPAEHLIPSCGSVKGRLM